MRAFPGREELTHDATGIDPVGVGWAKEKKETKRTGGERQPDACRLERCSSSVAKSCHARLHSRAAVAISSTRCGGTLSLIRVHSCGPTVQASSSRSNVRPDSESRSEGSL